MAIKKIVISTGTLVTGAGVTMLAFEVVPMVAAGVVGFGLAHIVLGAINMPQNKKAD